MLPRCFDPKLALPATVPLHAGSAIWDVSNASEFAVWLSLGFTVSPKTVDPEPQTPRPWTGMSFLAHVFGKGVIRPREMPETLPVWSLL